jgi:hypothetical protein
LGWESGITSSSSSSHSNTQSRGSIRNSAIAQRGSRAPPPPLGRACWVLGARGAVKARVDALRFAYFHNALVDKAVLAGPPSRRYLRVRDAPRAGSRGPGAGLAPGPQALPTSYSSCRSGPIYTGLCRGCKRFLCQLPLWFYIFTKNHSRF